MNEIIKAKLVRPGDAIIGPFPGQRRIVSKLASNPFRSKYVGFNFTDGSHWFWLTKDGDVMREVMP